MMKRRRANQAMHRGSRMDGELFDTIEHPNPRRHPGQRIFIVNVEGYAGLVPFAGGMETNPG